MNVPDFPAARDIALQDKQVFDEIFARLQPRVSEMTFANLFLFRRSHGYRVTRVAGSTVVLGRGYSGGEYFLPPLEGETNEALRVLLEKGLTLYGGDETFAERWLRGEGIAVMEDRDTSDYIYLRDELATLPGRKFHNKRNRIAYFASRQEYEVEIFSHERLPGCLELLEEWTRVRSASAGPSPSFVQEVAAAREGLELAEILGLKGVVVLVAGRVKAFALGEELNLDTSVCHFEKADPFLEGLSQLVDREFNRLLFTEYLWVNKEQDLGEQGIRASKLSYHPAGLVRKFRARREGAVPAGTFTPPT
jgi:uncharacterized protein